MRTLLMVPVLGMVMASTALVCGEEKPATLTGTYKKSAGDLDLKIVFKKDMQMEVHLSSGDVGCVAKTKYTRAKDGTLSCEITEFETKGDFPVKRDKGYKFEMKVEVKKGSIVVSNFKGDDVDENGKNAIEGEYKMHTD